MSEHAETPARRHARYLRYAAEARELAARTTDSVRDHHVRVAVAWEAMARKLAPLLPEIKSNPLMSVGGTVQDGSGAPARVQPALGHRTDAVRGRLADRLTRAIGRGDSWGQHRYDLSESTEDPSG